MKAVNFLNGTRLRRFDENVANEIIEFESNMKISLPPIFKLFYETYDLYSDWSPIATHYLKSEVISNKSFIPKDIVYLPFPDTLPPLEYVMDFATMKSAYKNYSTDGVLEKKLLPIIKLDNSMIVTLGFGKENLDKIVLLDTDQDDEEKFLPLADNIFHYFRGVEIKDSDFPQFYSKLYRNWEEDFWRIREDS